MQANLTNPSDANETDLNENHTNETNSQTVINTSVILMNENQTNQVNQSHDNSTNLNEISLPCKCGSTEHKRTTNINCVLNIKNINNLDAEYIKKLLDEHEFRMKNRDQERRTKYHDINRESLNLYQKNYRANQATHLNETQANETCLSDTQANSANSNEAHLNNIHNQANPTDLNETSLPCKCGSTEHKRTTHSSCILNKKNINNLDADYIKKLLDEHDLRMKNRDQERRTNYQDINRESLNMYQQNYRENNLEHCDLTRKEYQNANKDKTKSTKDKKKQLLKEKFKNIAKKSNFKPEDDIW